MTLPAHLTDHTEPITEEQASALKSVTSPFPHVSVCVIGGRPALCHAPTMEAFAFITNAAPTHVRWLAQGWSDHFEAEKRKASER